MPTPNYDCEIWIGVIVGTPGPPGKGEKWVPAEYLSTNAIGQLYVTPRSSSGPLYVDRSAFRWTTKPTPRLLERTLGFPDDSLPAEKD